MGDFGRWWINSHTRSCRDHLWFWDLNLPLLLRRSVPAVYWKPQEYSKLWPVTEGVQEDSWPNSAGSDALPPTWILLLWACFCGIWLSCIKTRPQPCPALFQPIHILFGQGEGELTSIHETALDRMQFACSCWTLRDNRFPFLFTHSIVPKWVLVSASQVHSAECLPYQYSLYSLDTADSATCFTKQNKHLPRIALSELRGETPKTDSRAGHMLFCLCGWV